MTMGMAVSKKLATSIISIMVVMLMKRKGIINKCLELTFDNIVVTKFLTVRMVYLAELRKLGLKLYHSDCSKFN